MMKSLGLPVMAIALALFGAVTLFMSTAVVFDLFGVREKQGAYVLFVVVVNFLCSLLYLPAAWGLYRRRRWAVTLLGLAAALLLLALGGLFFHIWAGKPYETKTVVALLFRLVLTALFAALGRRALSGSRAQHNRDTAHHH